MDRRVAPHKIQTHFLNPQKREFKSLALNFRIVSKNGKIEAEIQIL